MVFPITCPRDAAGLTAAGRRRLAEARASGYLLTVQGEDNGRIDAAWTAWCIAHLGVRVTVHRYRGVDHPAWSELTTSFVDLAGVQLVIVAPGACLAPRGISAVGQAFADAGIGGDQAWTLAPRRVSIGRVPVGIDERLARALLRIGRARGCTCPAPD
jgi:hypothetical protein